MNLKRMIFSAFAALILVGASAVQANEFLEFTVDEGSVPGAADNVIEVDKITGGYNERLTINLDLSIDFIGIAFFQGYFKDDGATPVPSQLGAFGGYNMYAIFEGSGNYNPITNTFSIGGSTLALYIDPNQDTTHSFPGGGGDGITLNDVSGDDYLIATATSLIVGEGVAGTPGAFLAIWDDFTLTDGNAPTDGDSYFIAPRPFHLVVEVTGDFDRDNFVAGDFTLTGDVSAVFRPVPEPSTLALMGLVLLGLGAVARVRRSS